MIDPRETWKQWFLRNLDFKDPPLVERSELPEHLQPQNRKLGKARHFFTKLTMSRLSQQPNYEPNKEVQSEMQEVHEDSKNSIHIQVNPKDQIETQTVS